MHFKHYLALCYYKTLSIPDNYISKANKIASASFTNPLIQTLMSDRWSSHISMILTEMEMARLPDLDGKFCHVHQPLAMCRFLARELDLAGHDEWEALFIDATVDELCGLKAQMLRILSTTEEITKKKLKEDFFGKVLPAYLKNIELQLENNDGFLVGGKMSWADIFFAVIFEHLETAAPPKLLKSLPKLIKLLHAVLNIPCLHSWKKRRILSESELIQLLPN